MMTFEELRIKLGGGPVVEDRKHSGPYCEIPLLPAEALDSIPDLKIQHTDFPGCLRFWVSVAEGTALYVGVVEIGRTPRKHGSGTLELFPWLGKKGLTKTA